eukprot:m.16554 g.16554  ORF g.16554 m.16554 type:complete len:783 (-) comp3398_c0_seq1:176-2524(-)
MDERATARQAADPHTMTTQCLHLSDPYSVLNLPYPSVHALGRPTAASHGHAEGRAQSDGNDDWIQQVRTAARMLAKTLHPDRLGRRASHSGADGASVEHGDGVKHAAGVTLRRGTGTVDNTCDDRGGTSGAPSDSQAALVQHSTLWVAPGTCDISRHGRSFAHVTAAAAMLVTPRTHTHVGEEKVATHDTDELDATMACAKRELTAAQAPLPCGEAAVWAMRARVCEILLEQEHTKLSAADPGRDCTLHDPSADPGDLAPHYRGEGTRRNRRKESKRARRRGTTDRGPASVFSKPRDKSIVTRHLHVANIGPRFGISPDEIARALRDVTDTASHVVVTAPGPSASHVFATFESTTMATKVCQRIDGRTPGAMPLLGRRVAVSYAEKQLPMVAVTATAEGAKGDGLAMSPAELLAAVRRAMAGTVDEEAGNLPEHRSVVTTVQCPLCSSSDAVFQAGRPFRMHLISPVHGLTGHDMASVMEAAELLAAHRQTDGTITEGASGTTALPEAGQEDLALGEPDWLTAARTGDCAALEQLRQAGTWDPETTTDRHGSTALHWAAGAGHVACIKWLVEVCNVPANQACTRGRADQRNALHWAARNGQTDACRWLVHGCGLDVDSPTVDGTTPFHWACWQRHFGCCRWLRDNGANVQAVNQFGCNAVHWAALSGNLQMCAWLYIVGVDLSLANTQGHTAVHKAAFNGHGKVVDWLVRHTRIDPGAPDAAGYTAAMIARERGHVQLATTLDTLSGRDENGQMTVTVAPDPTLQHAGPTGSLAPRRTKSKS